MRDANLVAQVSLVCRSYEQYETGAPNVDARIAGLEKLVSVNKRVMVRIQPYHPAMKEEVLALLPRYADIGIHGVIVEGMKYKISKPGLIKVAGDFVFPSTILKSHFQQMKDACHALGLSFYSGENRLRGMGDNPCCCGCADLPGFRVNTANLNHLSEGITYTDKQRQIGTAEPFRVIDQRTAFGWALQQKSYADLMDIASKSIPNLKAMGILPE